MSSLYRMRSLVSAIVLVMLWGAPGHARHGELPNRIPEAAPYNVTEAEVYPPPYENKWTTICVTSMTRSQASAGTRAPALARLHKVTRL